MSNARPLQDIVNQLSRVHTIDKATKHSYIETYEELFAPLKELPVTVVEAGVACGDSIKMWSMYFTHPDARIVGIDLDVSEMLHTMPPSVSLHAGDATDNNVISPVVANGIDIFIDDASHRPADMVKTFSLVRERVRQGGFYVFEDVPNDQATQLLKRVCSDCRFDVVDLRSVKGRYDDVLFIVRF